MSFTLRPDQLAAVQALRAKIAGGRRRIVCVAPTGWGKMVVISDIIRSATERGRRSLFICPGRDLIDQAFDKLKHFGVRPGVMMGNDVRRDIRLPCQIATAQTLSKRMGKLPEASLVIVDEAHHSMAQCIRDMLAAYPDATVLGFTATPWRTDGLGLSEIYEDSVLAATPGQLMDMGLLIRPDIFAYDSPDLHDLPLVAGDYSPKALGLACNTSVLVGAAVKEYVAHAAGKRALVFAVNVAGSMALAAEFKAAGFVAEHLDGGSAKDRRRKVIADFKAGRVQVLVACGLFLEGFDAPAAEVLICCRPTLSLPLWLQMLGRGMRLSPETGKTSCLVHDHAGNAQRHGFPDDERSYELTATPERTRAMKTCVDCGFLANAWKNGCCPKCGSLNALVEDPKPRGSGERQEKIFVEGTRISRKQIEAMREKLADAGRKDVPDEILAKAASATRLDKCREFLRLTQVAAERGFKNGWVSHQYRSTFGVWPVFQAGELDGVVPTARSFIPHERKQKPQQELPLAEAAP